MAMSYGVAATAGKAKELLPTLGNDGRLHDR
jgi:hypothetical protein